ncbi:MAG: hypothetical protein VX498_09045, partial [Myxococcota bacterium]|nr:hypothetical protein [Myxococcota bacterium]
MTRPCGLLLVAGSLEPDQVTEVLNEQGGPAWDRTVFRLLAGVDVRALVEGSPREGTGTALSLASSGGWFRHADDFANRLAAASGQPVLAAIESAQVSGYHLAQPAGEVQRRLTLGESRSWLEGVGLLLGEDLGSESPSPLSTVAREVHGDDPQGVELPGMFNFDVAEDDEWDAIVRLRGEALQDGCPWRPDRARDPQDEVPKEMRGLQLASAVRLPGPPRWARATRAEAIRRAEGVVRGDGWLCLIPSLDGTLAPNGTAVRILQLAPLSDGSALGVLHPRAAVRVLGLAGTTVSVEVIEEQSADDQEKMAHDVERAIEILGDLERAVDWSPEELRTSGDPARLLGWQL